MLPVATTNKEPPEYLVQISRFICNTRFEDLPPAVVDRAKRLIADLFGIVTAGNRSDELKALAETHLEHVQGGASWVIGTPHRASARDAGFLNGIASTWHDFDEGSTIAYSHPGSQTIPAVFAAAQELGVSGRELLLAVVLGYEACARVGMASKMRVSVHPHGTTGTIGSAVGIARMKGFDDARMQQTINVAATMAMTTNRQAMLDEAAYTAAYPDKQICDVVIRLRDGRDIRGRCEVMKGEPANPHRAADVEKKFFDLVTPVWGTERAKNLYEGLLALESVSDMRAFGRGFSL